MKFRFTEEQKNLILSLDLSFDPLADLCDDQIFELTGAVADYLVVNCFDENYEINSEGRICEDILDSTANQQEEDD